MPKNELLAMMARPSFDGTEDIRSFVRNAPVGTPLVFQGQPFVVVEIPERSDLSKFSLEEQEMYKKSRGSGPAPKTIMPLRNN